MTGPERERAKQIIVEIVRQAGGELENTTNLFKAFYHAHTRYSDSHSGFLSCWPIARMPYGPGIHHGGSLLAELRDSGALEISPLLKGGHVGLRFRVVGDYPRNLLPTGAEEAIAFGAAEVKGKSASQVSRESHEKSRSWRRGTDGQLLNAYVDNVDGEKFASRDRELRESAEIFWSALDFSVDSGLT